MAIRKFVILVAGHSVPGDPGAIGQGKREADENVQIVDKAYNLLAPHPNITVVKVPHNLDYVDSTNWINERYANLDDGVIVEVHKNSTPGATGIETYTGFNPDRLTLKLATEVNNGVVEETGLRNRGVKQGGFYLITYTNQRACLVECGFMQDDPLDDSADTKYARGIVKGVCRFFGEKLPWSTTPAKPAPKPTPKPSPKPAIKYEKITPKKVQFVRNARLWNFNFTEWDKAKPASSKVYKKGEIVDVVAIATNQLGGRYYMTAYSYNGGNIKATNGFNVADCADYLPPVQVIPPKQQETQESLLNKIWSAVQKIAAALNIKL